MSTARQIFGYGRDRNGSKQSVLVWSADSQYLAVGTERSYVYVTDRKGKVVAAKELQGRSRVICLDWDLEGEYIALVCEGMNVVLLWAPLTTNALEELALDQKYKVSWLGWSKTHPVLAVGDEKGYLTFYNKKTRKKIPTMGKHSKKVIAGDWSRDGLLVTGSEDKIITISNHTSESAGGSIAVKSEPQNVKWLMLKSQERVKKQSTVCCILNQKTLLIADTTKEQMLPLELMFESKYGKIVDYRFYGDGYVALGFSEGYTCHVSTHQKEMKEEVKSERIFNAPLQAMAVNSSFYKLALAGQDRIKVVSLADWKQIKQQSFPLPPNSGKVGSMEFSPDGAILCISTVNGFVYGYILSVNMQKSQCNEQVAMLSSPTQVMIMSCSSKKKGQVINNVNLSAEPSALALGPNHLAVRQGNNIKFYRWLKDKVLLGGGVQAAEAHFQFVIKQIQLNENHVALLDDKAKLHLLLIEGTSPERVFPLEPDRNIEQYTLTKSFLIMLDSTSRLKIYHLEDRNVILEHKADNAILRMFPNKTGTKIILLHQNGEINLFLTASQTYHAVKLPTQRIDRVLWDLQNSNEFALLSGVSAYSYVITRNNVFASVVCLVRQIVSLEQVQADDGQPSVTKVDKNALLLTQGSIYSVSGSALASVSLTSHSFLSTYKHAQDSAEGHMRYFCCNMALKRFKESLIAAKSIRKDAVCEVLGRKAIQHLQLEAALKAYQLSRNLSMVLSIEPLLHENEKQLLLGHVAMMIGKYDLAQQHYLASSQPLHALDMRCDIQDWFVATSLAKTIAPEQEPIISKRLAAQTESFGNNTEALKQFQKSIIANGNERHNVECFAGIARTSIKLGDVQRGFNLARDIKDKALLIDIAVVCQNMKQYLEAAQVFERAQQFQRAASLYLQLKLFKQAAPLMAKVRSPVILVKYARAKESQGAYKEAEQAYESAEAYDEVVRVNLNFFENWEKPRDILRNKCATSTVAWQVASYCEKKGIWAEAIEFMLMAGRKEQAFAMAQAHEGGMEVYAREIKECSGEERTQIAVYWESKSMWEKAAEQYEQARNHSKALRLYIKAGERCIEKMLTLVEKNSTQEALVQELLDYLMGQADEQPKDPIYTYRLYRLLKEYRKAAKIAVTIASQEQQSGNYKNAHDILFQSYQDIKKANVTVPLELQKKLSVLHSYVLAIKWLSKMDLHLDAAFLLNKVSKNIVQFPAHAASILTTTVMKAMKAQLKGLAYTWAIVACQQEYKGSIPQNYLQRVKRVAMRPVHEELPQPKSPCPFCKEPVLDYNDDCPKCLNFLPFCIASGKHVVADDLGQCRHCKFPMRCSYMRKALTAPQITDKTCPMCNTPITTDDIVPLGEAGVATLKRAPVKEEGEDKSKQ